MQLKNQKEKYLGDYLTKCANPLDTMEDRKQKGRGILSNIKVMLEEVPLEERKKNIRSLVNIRRDMVP